MDRHSPSLPLGAFDFVNRSAGVSSLNIFVAGSAWLSLSVSIYALLISPRVFIYACDPGYELLLERESARARIINGMEKCLH